jgi:hypothetical protein
VHDSLFTLSLSSNTTKNKLSYPVLAPNLVKDWVVQKPDSFLGLTGCFDCFQTQNITTSRILRINGHGMSLVRIRFLDFGSPWLGVGPEAVANSFQDNPARHKKDNFFTTHYFSVKNRLKVQFCNAFAR